MILSVIHLKLLGRSFCEEWRIIVAKNKAVVTNAMRMLKASKIEFKTIEYTVDEVGDAFGEKIAELTGISPDISFKTLVAKGDKTGIIVPSNVRLT